MENAAPRWAWVVATGLGTGRLRPAPGTWGSAAALAAWCLLSTLLATPFTTWVLGHKTYPHLGYVIYGVEVLFLAAPLAMCWLALRASDRVLTRSREKDPGCIVADAWAGMWITLWPMRWEIAQGIHRLFTPAWWRWLPALLVPFLVFRLLGMWKPWPIRQIQALPGGTGVVADDVVAGLYAIPIVMLATPLVLHLLGL